MRFKKELFDEFPELKEKRSKFSYKLAFHRDPEEFLKIIKSLSGEQVMPMLLWLYREEG